MMHERNAQIRSAFLGLEDHEILTISIMLDFGEGCQGFGGYRLDNSVFCATFIRRVLEVAGAKRWGDLVGKPVRVRKENELGRVLQVGHIIDNNWFDPEAEKS